MIKLVKERNYGAELRDVFVEALLDSIETNKKIIALDADLAAASRFTKIGEKYPNNFINVGIAEANMIGVAAGLSIEGFTPFVHSFAPFATRRTFDQIYMSGAYAQNTINIYGSDPGFAVGVNGGTHTSFEDVALMRTLPNALVCDAADAVQMDWIVREFTLRKGINYVRGNRKSVRNIYAEGSTFEFGKGNVVREGTDVLIISAGQLVSDALDAAEILEKDGISVEVIDMFCIKPLDEQLIIKASENKKSLLTFENHSIIGGLGSAVADVIAKYNINIKFDKIGINDLFGQVGTPDYLQNEYQLTTKHLIDRIITSLR